MAKQPSGNSWKDPQGRPIPPERFDEVGIQVRRHVAAALENLAIASYRKSLGSGTAPNGDVEYGIGKICHALVYAVSWQPTVEIEKD